MVRTFLKAEESTYRCSAQKGQRSALLLALAGRPHTMLVLDLYIPGIDLHSDIADVAVHFSSVQFYRFADAFE